MTIIEGGRDPVDSGSLQAGQILIYDFRDVRDQQKSCTDGCTPTLKCVQWNIERGYKLDHVILALQKHHSDIICLQELDIGCDRSQRRDCAYEIAKALRMKCAFFVEFEELYSPGRSHHSQGGGVHGNAILSRFDFEPRLIRHKYHPYKWERDGHLLREPRRGERAILAADISVPGLDRPVICYSLHLEVFCGIFGRLRHFGDALEDARASLEKSPYQLLFGDLNTMAHGIARFSPRYCRDTLRYMSIGYSEACWWQRYVLDVLSSDRDAVCNSQLIPYVPQHLGADDTQRLVNPHFYDPFSIIKDTTLRGYGGLFCGKLDWTLLRGWHVLGKGMDNHNYAWSDHKLLYVLVRPVKSNAGEDPGVVAYNEQHVPIDHRRVYLSSIFWTATACSALILGASWLVGRF